MGIHFLKRWIKGHKVKMIVHNSIDPTPDTDLWAILDKIGVLCVCIAQATRWLDTRARLKTTQGASIFLLRPSSTMSDAGARCACALALLSLFLALFTPPM